MTLASYGQTETYIPDGLLAQGAVPLLAWTVTLAGGQGLLPRGAVLGKVTASNKYLLSAAAANDGSQVTSLVLVHSTDTSTGDQQALAYCSGSFNARALTYGAGHSAATARESLRQGGIFIETALL